MTETTEYMTIKEVSEILKVSPATIRNWASGGYFRGDKFVKIPHLRFPKIIKLGRMYRINKQELEEWIRDRPNTINIEDRYQ